jgi:hypothetical protein
MRRGSLIAAGILPPGPSPDFSLTRKQFDHPRDGCVGWFIFLICRLGWWPLDGESIGIH